MVHVDENYIWVYDSLKMWIFYDHGVIMILLQVHSPIPLCMTMYEITYDYDSMIVLIERLTHEHAMNMMWKVQSHNDDSMVERTFSPNWIYEIFYELCWMKGNILFYTCKYN